MDTENMSKGKAVSDDDRAKVAERLRNALDALSDRDYTDSADAPCDGEILDILIECVQPGANMELSERECDQLLFERLALLIDPMEHEQLVEVTLIPTVITWKDELGDPCEVVECTFSVEDTEGLDIDSCVTFSGYTAEQLQSMVAAGSDEDFEVVEVGEPYKVSCRPVR